MRFFTPELYVRFNSPDDKVADKAYQEWEKAAEQYAQHLAEFRDRTPSQIQRLTELSLHDALILSRVEQVQAGSPFPFRDFPVPFPPLWYATAIVTVKDEDTIRSLIYCLWDNMRTRSHQEGWPFSKEGEHWLYDELEMELVDVNQRMWSGGYLHRILLSSGIELEIPFTTLFIHEFSLTKLGATVAE
jgi:hypothetical protein